MTDPLYRQRTHTPCSTGDYGIAVAGAWRFLRSEEAQKAQIACLWAQWALETGRGANCWNWNLVNVRAIDGQSYCELQGAYEFALPGKVPSDAKIIAVPTGVVAPAGCVCFLPAVQRFRAFDTIDDGARAYLAFLLRPSYAGPFSAVVAGDVRTYVQRLKAEGFFTGSEPVYEEDEVELFAEYMKTAPTITPPPPSAPDEGPQTDPSPTC